MRALSDSTVVWTVRDRAQRSLATISLSRPRSHQDGIADQVAKTLSRCSPTTPPARSSKSAAYSGYERLCVLSRAHGTSSSRNAALSHGSACRRRNSTAVNASEDTYSHRDATITLAQRPRASGSLVTEHTTTCSLQLPVRGRANVSAVARKSASPAKRSSLPNFVPNIGQTFELRDDALTPNNGQFIRIREVSQDPRTGLFILTGWILRRSKREEELVDFHPNELILLNTSLRTQRLGSWQEAALRKVVLSPKHVKYDVQG